jgi:hypothetical protein
MVDMAKASEADLQRRREAAVKRYTEICANIRALDENSFRLLGFVPLVTGAAIVTVTVKGEVLSSPTLMLLSLVGALVTFGLYRWERRNIQICKWLQERADEIEEQEFDVKEINKRQFAIRLQERPPKFTNPEYDDMQMFLGYPITQRKAEKIIYVTTILAWLALPLMVWLPTLMRMRKP